MKTIKMVADELNVTKQTIVNNAKNLNVSFEKENGVNYINNDDYLRIIEKITKKENRETVKEDSNKKYPEVENTVYSNIDSSDTLKTKVNELEKQIEIFETRAKNDEKYIGNLTKQLDQQNSNVNTLNKLLENQQILALESNKKIQKLEHQLEEERQLNYSFDTSTNDRQNIDAQEATYTTDPVNINPHQEEEKKIQNKDISNSQSDERTQDEEAPKEDVPSNQNDNHNDIEEKGEETQPKKGFWSRLFGN